MSTPALLLGAGLLFWGWQAQLLALAIPMAAILEAARVVSWRWEFSDKDLNRLADLINLVFAGVAVYLFSRYGPHGVYAVIRWLPVVLFPLLAAQLYSTRGSLNPGSLFLSVRRYQATDTHLPSPRIDLSYPYFATCVVAAGVAAYDTPWLYPGVLVLAVWGISSIRPRRYSVAIWAALVVFAALGGYAGQWGIMKLQLKVEELVLAWVKDGPWSETDPYRTRTAIGHIGRLKFSDRIVLRVRRLDGATTPLLLRQASYQAYRGAAWHADKLPFRAVQRGAERGTWLLDEASEEDGRIIVSGPIDDGRAVLALPGGAVRIEDLDTPGLRTNPYGAVRVDDGPGFVSYTVGFSATSGRDRPPTAADLQVPGYQQAGIKRIAREIGLPGQPAQAAIRRLQAFFQKDFRYSLAPQAGLDDLPPLAHFLLHSRRGHCEYFATATVLLLRAAGVPSRYATGYAAQESGTGQDSYVVRERHAHAWALAYVNGRWMDVDFTPSVWASLEEQQAPWWLPAYDLFSAAAFGFLRWQWSGSDQSISTQASVGLLAIAALLLGWRLYRHKRAPATTREASALPPRPPGPGSDSCFYRLLPYLERNTEPRHPGETLQSWLGRLGQTAHTPGLREALDLHYRHRFDPDRISTRDRARLKTLVDDWLAAQPPGGRGKRRSKN